MRRIGGIIERFLDSSVIILAGGLLILLTTLTFAEVISRYAFSFSTSQVSEYCVFFLVWISFITAGKALKEKKHINIGILAEVLTMRGKEHARLWLAILIDISLLVFSVIYCYLGVLDVMQAKASGFNTTIDYVPFFWVWYLALPVGSLLLLIYSIHDLVDNIRRLGAFRGSDQTEVEGEKQ